MLGWNDDGEVGIHRQSRQRFVISKGASDSMHEGNALK